MIRSILAGFLFLFAFATHASAQNCNTYPTNLTNGTNADATQVMGNFNYVLGCVRDRLTAARTYFVRTDGNDACNGLTNAAGSSGACAFLTIQKAVNTVSGLDINTNNVTIQVGDGTYTGAVLINGPWLGSGTVTLQGNTTTPANVIISVTGANAVRVQNAGQLTIQGFTLTASGASQAGLNAVAAGAVNFDRLVFGAADRQMAAYTGGSLTSVGTKTYSINAGGGTHHFASSGGTIVAEGAAVTVSGTPAFSIAFANIAYLGVAFLDSNSYSGSATGPRFNANNNGVIFTSGAGASYLPGSSAGSTATGGQYN